VTLALFTATGTSDEIIPLILPSKVGMCESV